MKIGIDARELSVKKAGIGWYIFHVLKNILETDKHNNYIAYSEETIDFPDFPNLTKVIVPKKGIFWHWATAKMIQKDNLDLYWSPSSPIVPAITKVPTVLTIHDLTNILFPQKHELKGYLIDKFFLKRAISKTKKILAVSNATKNDISKMFPRAAKKISVTHLGYDSAFKPLPKNIVEDKLYNLNIKEGYILFVGTLEPRKNVETILQAYSLLEEKVKNDHPLIIAGKRGWKYESIFQIYEELNLFDKVKFIDYVEFSDLPSLYNGADLFIFPSFYEGFGLPPLEAMACGVPVIASNTSSLPEVVNNAGILVDPTDEKEIAENIEHLLSDNDKRKKYAKKGIDQAAKFSWQKTARETLAALEK